MSDGLNDQIPMFFAEHPATVADPMAAQSKAYTMAGQIGNYQQAQKERADINQDEAIVKAAQQDPANDFTTPDGLDAAVKKLQGKISPAAFDKLQANAQAASAKHLAIGKALRELPVDKLNEATAANEKILQTQQSLLANYSSNVKKATEAGADPESAKNQAMAAYQAELEANLQNAASLGFKSDQIEGFRKQAATPEGLANSIKATQYWAKHLEDARKAAKEEAETAKSEASARKETSQALAIEEGGTSVVAKQRNDERLASGEITQEEHDTRAKYIESAMPKKGVSHDASMDQASLKREAAAYIANGTMSATMKNMGRGAQGPANLNAFEAEVTRQMEEQKLPPDEMAARKLRLDGATAGMRAAGTRSANVDAAALELDQFADNASEAFSHVYRTTGKPILLNDIIKRFEANATSSPEEAALATYLQSLTGAYATVIGRGKTTVESLHEADKIIGKSYDQAAFDAMIKALKVESSGVVNSTRKAAEGIAEGAGKLPKTTKGGADMQVSSAEQKARDAKSIAVKQSELKQEQALVSTDPTHAEDHQRNIEMLTRDLAGKTETAPDMSPPPMKERKSGETKWRGHTWTTDPGTGKSGWST